MKWIVMMALLLTGCGTTQRSSITPTSLDSIGTLVDSAAGEVEKSTALAKKIYAEGAKKNDKQVKLLQEYLGSAQVGLSQAKVEIKSKQVEIDKVTGEMNKVVDRLNYIEPKYAAAVGIIWRWRFITIGLGLVMVGYGILKFYFRIPFL